MGLPDAPRPWPRLVACAAATLVLGIGLFGLTAQMAPGLVPGWGMSALTALCLVLLAGSSLLVVAAQARDEAEDARLGRFAFVLSAIALSLALARLSGYLVGWPLGLDNLGFEKILLADGRGPARMSEATAIAVALHAGALLLVSRPRASSAPLGLALAGLLFGWLGLARYVYGGQPLPAFAAMAWPTATALLTLGVSILLVRRDSALIHLTQARTAGGAIVRRLMPAALLVPLIIGWLRLQAQRAGWFGTESGISLFALSNVAVFGTLVWFSARRLDRADRLRDETAAQRLAGQQLLQAIVDNSAAVIYAKDLEGRYLLVNRLYLSTFRLRQDAVLGRTDHDLFDAPAADAFRAMDRRVADAGVPRTEEETVPQDDGAHTYLSVKCPLRDGEGRVSGVFGISTDITERRTAQAHLETQLERLRLLDQITRAIGEHQDLQSIYQVAIRSLEDRLPVDFSCICRYDAPSQSLTVIRVGARSLTLALSLAMDERATIPIDENGLSRCVQGELVYEPDINALDFPFPRRLAGGGLGAVVVAPLRSESRVFGVLVAARSQPESFSSTDCEFLGQLSAHVALAARQAELHGALQRAYDDLRLTQQGLLQQERLRALGQMASGIAHDINNAISPVVLYAESLIERETGLTERGRAQLQTIARAIDDVAATVSRMREFYRQREPRSDLRPVQLNEMVRYVLELTRVRWQDMPQQRGTVVTPALDLAPDLPCILGDEPELREALTNLIFNAVDAMPEGGTLTLRTRCGGGVQPIALEVADTGIGMDEDTSRRCLEPFFTTKGERGTGLGLAMVYGIVQRHGARIDIASMAGSGTTVRLSFPPAGDKGTLPPIAPPAAPMAPLHILLVDDDPVVLKSIGDTLMQDGHSVVPASGGQAGIDALHAAAGRRPFDVVITDLGMPYVDGRRVAAAAKQMEVAPPVLMLTGWGRRLAADGDVPAHVDLMLAKPAGLTALRAALAQVMRTAGASTDPTTGEPR